VLARTGSDNGTLVGIGLGAVAVGAGLVVFARKRRLAAVPA
jgi:LPXTG-motif cell wall-anchored protein